MAAAALTRLARAHDGELVIGVWNGGHRYHQMARRILERGGGQMLYFENGILPEPPPWIPRGELLQLGAPGPGRLLPTGLPGP
ncbi:hypothetical protein HML84_16360 [Alcanivorax sp. IO_7]|nr:hypothetical protein HML84_16360 [Alcanivorax sp. IO_7]